LLLVGAVGLGGCNRGELQWEGNRETWLTALYRETSTEEGQVVEVVLSTGFFGCDLPESDDAATQDRAIQEFVTAMCREGARHLSVDLIRPRGGLEGRYHGAARTDAIDGKVARAAFYSVDEAFLVEIPGFSYAYGADEETYLPHLGPGGDVVVDQRRDRLVGDFSFPDANLWGDFRAERCAPDSDAMSLLDPTPSHLCP